MIEAVMYWLCHLGGEEGTFNYITSHTGFTLNDLVSYDGKHNEANGEKQSGRPRIITIAGTVEQRGQAVSSVHCETIKSKMRYFLCCLRRERHAFWQEMNSGTHREAITMSIVRITLQAG